MEYGSERSEIRYHHYHRVRMSSTQFIISDIYFIGLEKIAKGPIEFGKMSCKDDFVGELVGVSLL